MGLFGKPDPKPANETAAPAAAAPATAAPPPAKPQAKSTVMGEKTRYVGKVETDEPLLIQGKVEGEIRSTSEVEVGQTGDVKATITARSIAISGHVVGDCTATERIEIRASGRVSGVLKSPRMVIAEGAEFKGTSQMGAKAKA